MTLWTANAYQPRPVQRWRRAYAASYNENSLFLYFSCILRLWHTHVKTNTQNIFLTRLEPHVSKQRCTFCSYTPTQQQNKHLSTTYVYIHTKNIKRSVAFRAAKREENKLQNLNHESCGIRAVLFHSMKEHSHKNKSCNNRLVITVHFRTWP
jgi:hypothetical protein